MSEWVGSGVWIVLAEPPSLSGLDPEAYGPYPEFASAHGDVARLRASFTAWVSELMEEEYNPDDVIVSPLQLGQLKGE